MKKVLVALLTITALGVSAYFVSLKMPARELRGNPDIYNTATLQLGAKAFYDVRVPVEAQLLETDGASIYVYDLLTVGLQDVEPSSRCKVKVDGRWVFATSKENWLAATYKGFATEGVYNVPYTTAYTLWDAEVPEVTQSLDDTLLNSLRDDYSYAFGGTEFITTQIMYGTFENVVDKALWKMSSLYKRYITQGIYTAELLWVSEDPYTVAVKPINYNTCMMISACGETGQQYAAALIGGEIDEG